MTILQSRRSRITTAVLSSFVVIFVGSLSALRVGARASEEASETPLPEVDVATVLSKSVTDWQSYSGRLEAVERVEVRPLVSGTIVSVNFRDGALVKKGDVMFVIDPRPYRAEVDRASAQLSVARARNDYAQSDWQRAQRLIGDSAIAKRDYDEKQNAAHEAAANLKGAKAAFEIAQINLGYTRIVAPVTGRASRAEMTEGNVVSSGTSSAPLTTLVSVSPIYASFDADEQTYLQYLAGTKDSRTVPVALGLANESGYSRNGVIDSMDNRLDPASGTIRVRARFDNPDGTLVPGLYARLKVGGSVPHDALLIDDSAISTNQDKKFVFVVDAQGRASYREVRLGAQVGGQRVITSGLQASERIVVNGMQRVRPGEHVKVHVVPMSGGDAASNA